MITKLSMVSVALLLGGYNRLALTPGVMKGDTAAASRMKAIIVAEIILVALVLAVTALWRFTPPPRALALRPPIVASVHMHSDAAMATVTFDQPSPGRSSVEVSVATGDFEPLDPKEVTLKLASDDRSIAPFEVKLTHRSQGLWKAENVVLPENVEWTVKVEMLVSDFDLVTLEDRLILPSR